MDERVRLIVIGMDERVRLIVIVLGETHVLPGRSGCREAQACAAWTCGQGARSSIIIAQGTGLLGDRSTI